MKQYSQQWTIQEMAKVLEVSRSGYYRYCQQKLSQRQRENGDLLERIKTLHLQSRQTYGSPRIQAALKAQGFIISRQRVARIMQKAGIRAKMQQLFKTKKTTRVNAQHKVAPNLVQQNFTALQPNKSWMADISYVFTLEGWLYMAVILDIFSRRVIGLAMADSLQTELIIKALQQALMRRQPATGLWHHSDRGCQYTSRAFQNLLKAQGIICSMSAQGYCYDNAAVESFFHTLKTEHIYFEKYETREQAKQSIFEYVEVFYNNERRHSSLGYVSPAEFERHYYQQHNFQLLSVH
jgi:putative transposase